MRMPAVMRGLHCRTRIGRGGRLLLDRVHPLTREPYMSCDHAASLAKPLALPMPAAMAATPPATDAGPVH